MRTALFSICAVLLLALAGCATTPAGKETQSADPIKIGIFVPLTGEAASFGQNALAGATLAANEINAKGGINGHHVQIIAEDDACSSKSVSAVRKLIEYDHVLGVLGSICSAAVAPAAPIVQQNHVPMIITAASAPGLTKDGEYIFRIYPADTFEGSVAAEHMYNDLGVHKVAIISVKDDWGQGLHQVFKVRFTELGGEIVHEGSVLPSERDFKTELEKARNSGAQALYLPLRPATAVAAMKQVKESGIELPIVGGSFFDGPDVIGSGHAEGTRYAMAKIVVPEDFRQRVNAQQGFENLEVDWVATLGYDAMHIMAQAMSNGTDATMVQRALMQTSYEGLSNPRIEFDSERELKSAVFEIKAIRNGTSEALQ